MEKETWEFELIRTRIAATQEAQKRTRLAFLAVITVSTIMILSAWNTYLSWDRQFLTPEKYVKTPNEDIKQLVDFAREQLIAEWVKGKGISVPLLGVRISSSDAAVVGAFSILILELFFVLSMRRENRTLGKLLIGTRAAAIEVKELVFHGVTSTMLLTDLGESDQPISRLTFEEPTRPTTVRLGAIFKLLIFLPLAAVLIVITCDILSLYWFDAVLRYEQTTLARVFEQSAGKDKIWMKIAVYEASALVVAVILFGLSRKAYNFEKANGLVLREYSREMAFERSALATTIGA